MTKYYKNLLTDFLVIIFTTFISLYIVKDFHFEPNILLVFVAGIFFTSAFTIAPAAIVLSHLSESIPAHWVVIFGALGAMVGDMILFLFIRDRFSVDLMKALKHSHWKNILRSFHFGFLKWLSPLIGAFIIATPLPDEFGIMLMGVSKMKTRLFLLISFLMNMIGVIGVVALSGLF